MSNETTKELEKQPDALQTLDVLVKSIEKWNASPFAVLPSPEEAVSAVFQEYSQALESAKAFLQSEAVKTHEAMIRKAEKWDQLEDKIAEFYPTYDDDGEEIPAKRNGDLGTIGEAAATAFGYL